MLVKFYFYTWAALLLVAGVLWIGGAFTNLTAIIVGVIAETLVFSGLMGLLPSTFHNAGRTRHTLHLVEAETLYPIGPEPIRTVEPEPLKRPAFTTRPVPVHYPVGLRFH